MEKFKQTFLIIAQFVRAFHIKMRKKNKSEKCAATVACVV